MARFKRVRNAAEAQTKQISDAQVAAAEESAKKFSEAFSKNFGIGPAAKAAEKPLTNLGGRFAAFQKSADASLGKVGLSLRGIAVLLGAGLSGQIAVVAIKALISTFTSAVAAASALHEALEATRVVFGASSSEIEIFAKNASSLGLSTTAALDASRAFGVLFTGVGANVVQAQELSESLVRLAADVASFQNVQGGAAEVARRFRSALVGNFEAVEALGRNIRASDVENRLLTLGLIKSRTEITSNIQTLGTLIVLEEKFAFAQGDVARTSEDLANSTRRLGADFTNMKASLGALFVELATTAVHALDGIVRAIKVVVDALVLLQRELDKTAKKRQELQGGSSDEGFVGLARNPIEQIRDGVNAVRKVFLDAKSSAKEFVDAFNLMRIDDKGRGKALKEIEQNFGKDAADRVRKYIKDQQAAAAATGQTTEALIKQEAALNAIKKAQQNVVPNTIAFLQAQQSVVQADKGLRDSLVGVIRAEEALADLRRDQARIPLRIAQAELAVAQARLQNEQATFAVGDAERGLRRAREGELDAARDLIRANEDIADAERNVRRAQEDIPDAVRATVRAREDQVTAIQHLVDVQEELSSNRPIIEAQLNFEQAQLKVQEATLGTTKALQEMLDAQLALVDAQFDLERAQRRGRAGARDQLRAIVALEKAKLQHRDAELAPLRATLDLRDAMLSLSKAQLALAKVLSGTDAQEKLRDAQRGVEDANTAVRDSDRGLEDAHESLQNADRGLEDAHIKVRDANNAVEDSSIAVREAQFALRAAHFTTTSAALALASAENALDDVLIEAERAPQRLAEAEQGLKDAHDAVKAAAFAAGLAHFELKKILDESQGIIRSDAELLGDLATALGNVAANGHDAADAAERLRNIPFTPGSLAPNPDFLPGGRYGNAAAALAKGGPLMANQLALVGEKGMEIFQAAGGKAVMVGADGPEFFRPSTAGQVIPNSQISQFMRMLASRAAPSLSSSSTTHRGGDINTNVYVKETDPDVIGHKISRYIARKSKR